MPLPSQPDSPTFLVDRSLGRYTVPDRVVALGYACLTLADFYQDEQAAQSAADTAWLSQIAPYGHVILTRDGNLYFHDHERVVVERCKHRIFWLGPKKGPGTAWADRFEDHHERIVQYAALPGPYVVKVFDDGLHRAWP
jgi:hypothetical protein